MNENNNLVIPQFLAFHNKNIYIESIERAMFDTLVKRRADIFMKRNANMKKRLQICFSYTLFELLLSTYFSDFNTSKAKT